MSRVDLKTLKQAWSQKKSWPFFWITGQEAYLIRELLTQMRKLWGGASCEWTETFEGPGTSAYTVVDAAQSLSLDSSLRLILIRQAQGLADLEQLASLWGQCKPVGELQWIVVAVAQDWDGRKKFAKTLLSEKSLAAVVHCEAIAEPERAAWIAKLLQKKKMRLNPERLGAWVSWEPWSLDFIDQELEKLKLSGEEKEESATTPDESVWEGVSGSAGLASEDFVKAFLQRRDLKSMLTYVECLVEQPDLSFPLIGLLSWYVRHLAFLASDQRQRRQHFPLSSYWKQKMAPLLPLWSFSELLRLQTSLVGLDFSLKQTGVGVMPAWTEIILRFARN